MSLLYQFTVNDQFPVLVVELKELEGSPLLYDDFILSAEIGLRADSVPVFPSPGPESGKGLRVDGPGFLLQEDFE